MIGYVCASSFFLIWAFSSLRNHWPLFEATPFLPFFFFPADQNYQASPCPASIWFFPPCPSEEGSRIRRLLICHDQQHAGVFIPEAFFPFPVHIVPALNVPYDYSHFSLPIFWGNAFALHCLSTMRSRVHALSPFFSVLVLFFVFVLSSITTFIASYSITPLFFFCSAILQILVHLAINPFFLVSRRVSLRCL